MKKSTKYISILILILLLAGGAWYFLHTSRDLPGASGISFEQKQFEFNITRDIDQGGAVTIVNNAAKSQAVRVEDQFSGNDIALGTVGPGSEDGPLVLQPGAHAMVRFNIFAQSALQDSYTVPVTLYASDTNGVLGKVLDTASIHITVKPQNVSLTVSQVSQDPATLATTFKITNTGDPVGDLSVIGEPALANKVYTVPTVQDTSLDTGESLTIEVFPVLDEHFTHLAGSLSARVGKRDIPFTVDFTVPTGKQVYIGTYKPIAGAPLSPVTPNGLASVLSLARVDDTASPDSGVVNVETSAATFCPNKGTIDLVIGGLNALITKYFDPDSPDFIGQYIPEHPWTSLWSWWDGQRENALTFYENHMDEALANGNSLEYTLYNTLRLIAAQGTKGKLTFLASFVAPGALGSLGNEVWGAERLVTLEESMAEYEALKAAGKIKVLEGVSEAGAVAGVGGGADIVGAGNVAFNPKYWVNGELPPVVEKVLGSHEAAHLLGASEYNAYMIQNLAYGTLTPAEELTLFKLSPFPAANYYTSRLLPQIYGPLKEIEIFGSWWKYGFGWNPFVPMP